MEKIAVVNGLRGVAILGVLFQHAFLAQVAPQLPESVRALATNGWTGVNLFFILSGFVLTLPYATGRRQMASLGDAMGFYAARARRLLPLYAFAGVILLVIAGPILAPAAFVRLAVDLATLRFVLRPHDFGVAINFPLWSIGVEILFSLAFPLVLIAAQRAGFLRLLIAALVAALMARIFGRIWDPHRLGANFVADNLFGRIDEFVLGMVMARLYVGGRIQAAARHLAAPGVALILLSWFGFYQCQYGGLPTVAMAPLNNVLDLGFAAVLAAALARPSGRSVLVGRVIQVAGMMCYSLYIWHAPVLETIEPTHGLIAALAVLLAVSALSYRYVEFGRVADARVLFLWRGSPGGAGN